MTNYITTHFNERGEAHVDESQLEHLDFDTEQVDICNLVTNTISFKSEDIELVSDLKQLASTQS